VRIRTALAVTALAAAAVLGASGTALAHDDDHGGHSAYRFENLGGPAGITHGAAVHGDGDDDGHGWESGFFFENLGGPAGITKVAGYSEGDDDH
jgi:hypothetical protein